jgi:hypothetical protein
LAVAALTAYIAALFKAVHYYLAQPISFGARRSYFAEHSVYEIDELCAFLLDVVNGFAGRGLKVVRTRASPTVRLSSMG